MEKDLIVLRSGMQDAIDILSEFEMDKVLGGEIKCRKKYELNDDGSIICDCGYSSGLPTG